MQLEELAKTDPFRSEIRKVFFEAMNKGYATKPVKGTIAELPGSKTITYARKSWVVIDAYLVTPQCSRSGGMTIISYENVPVWMMQYFGEYDEKSIPCLKASLCKTYAEERFCGGRGSWEKFTHGEFTYQNLIEHMRHCDFDGFFNGEEEIRDGSGKIRGWHSYQGGIMI